MLNVVQLEKGAKVETDVRRDELLTKFGRAVLDDRYLMPEEGYQELFARVASHFADNTAHAQRLYGYMSRWLYGYKAIRLQGYMAIAYRL